MRRHQQPAPTPIAVLVGDEVEANGLIGTVVHVDDDVVHLEVDTDITVRVTLASITRTRERHTPTPPAPTASNIDNWIEQIRSR